MPSIAIATMRSVAALALLAIAASIPAMAADRSAVADVAAVLDAYNRATQSLDLSGTERLFTADSEIIESGGVEGTYATYLVHHIGPELSEFKSFTFNNYAVHVEINGTTGFATETFGFRIVPKNGGAAVDRLAVASSVLTKTADGWKIARYHWSSRRLPEAKP